MSDKRYHVNLHRDWRIGRVDLAGPGLAQPVAPSPGPPSARRYPPEGTSSKRWEGKRWVFPAWDLAADWPVRTDDVIRVRGLRNPKRMT